MAKLVSAKISSDSPEMEKLLKKYSGGDVPPLVTDEKEEGLLGEEGSEILEIYREGFSVRYNIPLRIFPVPESRLVKTITSDQNYNYLSQKFPCKLINSFNNLHTSKEDKKIVDSCKDCLEKHIWNMQNGKSRAYMCCSGMISLLAPVHVSGRLVAILTTECRKPKNGIIWHSKLVDLCTCKMASGGTQITGDDTSPSADKLDLWEESKNRIHECEKLLGLKPNELLEKVNEMAENNPGFEIAPDELETIMKVRLEKASKYLSDLAEKTYRLEKESVLGWLRAEMASALSSVETFWDEIQRCLENLAQLVGIDYILLISYDKLSEPTFQLRCQYGLSEESLPALNYNWSSSTGLIEGFIEKIKNIESIQEIDLRQYRDLPILGALYSFYGKGTSHLVLVAPAKTLGGGLTCMILGKKNPMISGLIAVAKNGGMTDGSTGSEWLNDDDRNYLTTIAREIAIITSVFFSMKKIQETKEEQTNLMESVAHDLRTPIQNIMAAAENLRRGRIPPERASRTIASVVTQLERLNLLAQKAWMLEQIRMDKLIYDDDQVTDVYKILIECRDIMADMADREGIEIHIDPTIRNWRSIRLDAEKFRLVVMNLIHNGIRYSFSDTCVRVGGFQDVIGIGVVLTFENEGIPIRDEEKDRIFERHFRSKDAIKKDPAGSGIGLALTKEFVDHYKGRIDVTSTEIGFGRYLNVFSMFLPGR